MFLRRIGNAHVLAIAICCSSIFGSSIADAQSDSEKSDAPKLPEGVQVQYDIQYGMTEHGPLMLDLYRPQKIAKKLPVIVFIHGGGWKGGDKKSALKNAAWIVPEGYAVASINYRLLDRSNWPTQVNDCYAAVRWVRDNAVRYQLDGQFVIAWGTSAGAHLASLIGTRPNSEPESTSSRVQAVIDWFGPSDLLTMPPNVVTSERSLEEVSKSNGARLLGATVRDVPELARQASALHQVSRDDPPTLIMHGDQDTGVPLDQSARFAEKLKAAGVAVHFEVVKGAGHGGKEFHDPKMRDVVREFLQKYR